MIQFNLLPDVKLDYVKAKRVRRSVFVACFFVSAGALTALILMFMVVGVFQKQHLKAVSSDIDKYNKELHEKEELPKILTVQNQLISLTCTSKEDFKSKPCLHDNKPAANRLFTYLTKIVPEKVSISETHVDFDAKTIKFQGNTPTLNIINTFVDTLKFTTFKNIDGQEVNAFSKVVLTSFQKSQDAFTYTIDLAYDAQIFDSKVAESMKVPKTITTRSVLDNPTKDLFKEQPKTNTTAPQGAN